ncbi:MAG: hypothetical protein ACK5P4_12835 [Bacteroidota bacterium]|jgi:general stress protein CsbA
MTLFEKNIKYMAFISVCCACIIFLGFKQFKQVNINRCISSDGKGYYAYLPALFIYQDIQFSYVDAYENKYYNPQNKVDFTNTVSDKQVNKYWSGVAVMILPFFLFAHTLAILFNQAADGYSFIYQAMVAVAACFYLVLGLVFLRKLLLRYTISESVIGLTLFSLVFATNLFYYTVAEPSMSHVYSFCLICLFAYTAKKYFDSYITKYWYILILLLALITLLRPSNMMVAFACPFFAGSFNNLKKGVAQINKGKLMKALLIFFTVLSIQLAYYKWATGNFWVYSYGNEHFNFLHPQFFDFLFSYRKGLFVYAPILLLATIGFTVLYKQSPFQMMSLFAFMILIVFVLSSWWMWYYGGGFGMRPMIDYFVFFAFLLSLLIQRIMNSQKGGYVAMLMLMILCVAAQIQTYQKVNFIMPWDGMNKEIYWKIFLKTDKSYIGKYKA